MVIVSGQQDAPLSQGPGLPENPEGFDEGRDSAFHVGGTRSVEDPIFDTGGDKGKVNGIQMAVELEGAARSPGFKPDDDGRGLRPIRNGSLDDKTVLP